MARELIVHKIMEMDRRICTIRSKRIEVKCQWLSTRKRIKVICFFHEMWLKILMGKGYVVLRFSFSVHRIGCSDGLLEIDENY